jgi:hypothetical protein
VGKIFLFSILNSNGIEIILFSFSSSIIEKLLKISDLVNSSFSKIYSILFSWTFVI